MANFLQDTHKKHCCLLMRARYGVPFVNSSMSCIIVDILHHCHAICDIVLTHLPLDKMAAILADDIFKCIFLNEKNKIPIQISLKLVPRGPIDNKPALVQVMVWRRTGDKPLPEPMMAQFTDTYNMIYLAHLPLVPHIRRFNCIWIFLQWNTLTHH